MHDPVVVGLGQRHRALQKRHRAEFRLPRLRVDRVLELPPVVPDPAQRIDDVRLVRPGGVGDLDQPLRLREVASRLEHGVAQVVRGPGVGRVVLEREAKVVPRDGLARVVVRGIEREQVRELGGLSRVGAVPWVGAQHRPGLLQTIRVPQAVDEISAPGRVLSNHDEAEPLLQRGRLHGLARLERAHREPVECSVGAPALDDHVGGASQERPLEVHGRRAPSRSGVRLPDRVFRGTLQRRDRRVLAIEQEQAQLVDARRKINTASDPPREQVERRLRRLGLEQRGA